MDRVLRMPRVSDAYRQARRDEIVAATLRVLRRRALNDVTMADIIGESGLSAGSVYSHFTRKDELLELVAVRVIGERLDVLHAPDVPARSPLEVVRWWLAGLEDNDVPLATVVQIWGEAAADGPMRDVVQRRMGDIESAFAAAAGRWLVESGGDVARAGDVGRTMLTLCQGYIVRSAVSGPQGIQESIAALDVLGGL